MKLYAFPVAPNPTKVRLYLAEKAAAGAAIPITEEVVDLRAGEQKRPEHLARNPFGKLPVLELDDGSHLLESLVIIEYLEECFPTPPLIGRTARERARVREVERIADVGVLMNVGRLVHATNSPLGLPPAPEVAAHARAALPLSLAVLEQRLADGGPFLAGDQPTIADCTLAAALQFARFGQVDLDPKFTHLARWDAAFRQRPSARSVLML